MSAAQPSGDRKDERAAKPLIDVDLLKRRRYQLHITQREFGTLMGWSAATVSRFERGLGHAARPVSTLYRIAEVLSLPVTVLLLPAAAPSPPGPAATPAIQGAEEAGYSDAVVIEAALLTVQNRMSARLFAQSLGWTHNRVLAAIAELRSQLAGTARGLGRSVRKYSLHLVEDVLSPEQSQALLDARGSDRGLHVFDVQLAYRAFNREFDGAGKQRWLSLNTSTRLARLMLTGVLQDVHGGIELTKDARFGLMLDAEPSESFVARHDTKQNSAALQQKPLKRPPRGQGTRLITELLKGSSDRSWSPKELQQAIKDDEHVYVKDVAIRGALGHMLERGEVRRVSRGRYQWPAQSGDSAPS